MQDFGDILIPQAFSSFKDVAALSESTNSANTEAHFAIASLLDPDMLTYSIFY